MKMKGLMLLVAATVTVAVMLGGCKKKEQPAPPKAAEMKDMQKQAETVAAEAEQTKEEIEKEMKEAQEAMKKLEDLTEQTTCPVMDGNKINKDVFVEYKGIKVYFCCNGCKAKFEADPEKYTANLPQFQK
jgi:YHS domain-containing protein/outer membrane murein-binding lipoprotein Lpp